MSVLKKRATENVHTDGDSSKKVKTDFKLHNFKKKKLKHMHGDSQKNTFLSALEDLLSHKKEWQEDHVERLFSIMHDHFEVVNIYGFQIENAILEFIDGASSDKAIQLAALCMSRFASIKKANGTVLLQNILSTFLKLGKDYFDYFNIPSNLNEIKYTFKGSLLGFSELIISDDTILQLVKRIKFLIYVTRFIFETNYDMNVYVPFENLTKTLLGFLSTTPKELIDYSKKTGMQEEIPFYVNIHIWRLFQQLSQIPEFKGLFFDIIPKICEIIRLCLSENFDNTPALHQLYLSNILDYLSCLLSNEARYCLPTVSCLIETIIENIASITAKAHSSSHENIVTLYLQIINKLISFYHDKSIQKCVNTFSSQLNEIKGYLVYLESKSIYCTSRFVVEFELFVKLTNKFVLNKSRTECLLDSFKFEEKNNNLHIENEQQTENVDFTEESMEKYSLAVESAIKNVEETIGSSFVTEPNSFDIQEMDVNRNVEESIESVEIEKKNEEIITEEQEIETHEQKITVDISEQLQLEDKIISLEEMLMTFVPY